jgi:hypothetical protein
VNKRRSPQEKKRLSYSKDRRNWYGENDKSSRKNIARNKRLRHRAERHHAHQQLTTVVGPVDEHAGELAEERATARRQSSLGRKFPDVQLGVYVTGALAKRVRKDISRPETEQARIAKILRSTTLDGTTARREMTMTWLRELEASRSRRGE